LIASTSTLRLADYLFAKDIMVGGTAVWRDDKSFSADLTVKGSGTSGGRLRLEGSWIGGGPAGKFKISGMLGGRKVALLLSQS
jgi:hypothetical protein